MQNALEIRSALPRSKRRNQNPPLLFVHGAYCDAWCWEVHILPWFAAAGYPAYALSLRGHGKSPGRDDLGSLHLDDYMDDIRQVVAELPARPVLIGHSMGAALVERLIAEETYPGAALICPVPPSGLLPVLTRLWWGRPDFFWHGQKLHRGAIDPVAMSTLREFYFTTNAPPEILAGAMRHLSPESPQAVMELAWRGMSRQAAAHDTPMCVIAAADDALFTPDEAQGTAARHGIEAIVLEGLPHMLMLEPGWELLAETLRDWIKRSVRAPGPAPAPPRPDAATRDR
jgi:pimeloyl-ACP methyl ester carboxylesterase